MIVAWWLLGCPRPPPPPPVEALGPPPVLDVAPTRRRAVEPEGYWSESGGLCLEVPADWRGTAGPEPHVLTLEHDPTGVRLDVFAWAAPDPPPPEAEGWELRFEDDEGYRTVPLLSPARTQTWAEATQPGATRQTWSGQVGRRQVRVEATYPFGTTVQGADLVEPLLQALCTTFQ